MSSTLDRVDWTAELVRGDLVVRFRNDVRVPRGCLTIGSRWTDRSCLLGKGTRHGWPSVCRLPCVSRRLRGRSPCHRAAEDRTAPTRPALRSRPRAPREPALGSGRGGTSSRPLGPPGAALAPALGRRRFLRDGHPRTRPQGGVFPPWIRPWSRPPPVSWWPRPRSR